MLFFCGRSFRLLGTECRQPGAKRVVLDFKWYDVVMRVVRATIAGIAVFLLASVYGFVYVFCNVFPGVLLALSPAYIRHVLHDSMGSPKY